MHINRWLHNMLFNGIFMLVSFSIHTLCFPIASQPVNDQGLDTSHLSSTAQGLCNTYNDTSDTSLMAHLGSFNVPNTAYTVMLNALPQCIILDPYNIKYAFKAMDASLSLRTADEPVKSDMEEETGKVQLTLKPLEPANPTDPHMTNSEAMEVLEYTWGYLKVYKLFRPLNYSFLKMAQHVAVGGLSSTVQALGNDTRLFSLSDHAVQVT